MRKYNKDYRIHYCNKINVDSASCIRQLLLFQHMVFGLPKHIFYRKHHPNITWTSPKHHPNIRTSSAWSRWASTKTKRGCLPIPFYLGISTMGKSVSKSLVTMSLWWIGRVGKPRQLKIDENPKSNWTSQRKSENMSWPETNIWNMHGIGVTAS